MEGLYSKLCDNCPYCNDRATTNKFYKIAEFEDGGLEIWHSGERNASDKAPEGDVFILRITKNTGRNSNTVASNLDVRQVNCPRCRVKLSHVQKLMQSVPVSFKKGVTGVCDHCAIKQTPQDPCYSCAKTLKEFLTFEKEKWKRGQPPYYDRDQPSLLKQMKGIEVTDICKPFSSLRGWHSEDSITKEAKRSDYFTRDHTKETRTRDKVYGSAEIITGTTEPEKRVDADQRHKVPGYISGKTRQDDSEIKDDKWEPGKYKDQRGKRDLDQQKYKPTGSTDDIDPRTGTKIKKQTDGTYDTDTKTDAKVKQKPLESKVDQKDQFDKVTRDKSDKTTITTKDKKDDKEDRSEIQKRGVADKSAKDKAGEKVSRSGDGQDYVKGKKIEPRDVEKKDKVDKTARDVSSKKSEQDEVKKSKSKMGGGETATEKSKEKASGGGDTKVIDKKGEKTKPSEKAGDKSREKETDKKGEKTKPTEVEKSGKTDKLVKSKDGKGDGPSKIAESREGEKKSKVDKTDKSLEGGTPKDKTGKKVTTDSDVKGDEKEGKSIKSKPGEIDKAKDSTTKDKTQKEGRSEKDKTGKKVTTDSDVKDDEKEGKSKKSKSGEIDKFAESAKKGDSKSDKKKTDISEVDKKGKSDKFAKNKLDDKLSKDEEKSTETRREPREPRAKSVTLRDESGKKLKPPTKDKGVEEKVKESGKASEKTGQEKDDEKSKKSKQLDKKAKDTKEDGKPKKDQGGKTEKVPEKSEKKKSDDKLSVPADKVKIQQSAPDLITKLVQQRERDRDNREVMLPDLLPKLPKKRRIVRTTEMTETDRESELELDRDDAAYVSEETKEIIVGTQIYPRSEVHIKPEPPMVMTDFEEEYFPSGPLQDTASKTDQDREVVRKIIK